MAHRAAYAAGSGRAARSSSALERSPNSSATRHGTGASNSALGSARILARRSGSKRHDQPSPPCSVGVSPSDVTREKVHDVWIVANLRGLEAKPGDRLLERRIDPVTMATHGHAVVFIVVVRGGERTIDEHDSAELGADRVRDDTGCETAERMPDHDRRDRRLEQAGGLGHGHRLTRVLLERVRLAPTRTTHAGQREGDDATTLREQGREEAPPVGMRRESMQQQQSGTTAFTPGEHLDFGTLDLEMGSLRSLRERSVEPRRRDGSALDDRALQAAASHCSMRAAW